MKQLKRSLHRRVSRVLRAVQQALRLAQLGEADCCPCCTAGDMFLREAVRHLRVLRELAERVPEPPGPGKPGNGLGVAG